MQFTRRTRRRILGSVLPLVAIAWLAFPCLPCCQLFSLAVESADLAPLVSLSADAVTTDSADHCPDMESEESTVVCATDDIRNGSKERPVPHLPSPDVAAIAYLTSFLRTTDIPKAVPAPPGPQPRRSLHLKKSVLLI